jgi:hypothetical protein
MVANLWSTVVQGNWVYILYTIYRFPESQRSLHQCETGVTLCVHFLTCSLPLRSSVISVFETYTAHMYHVVLKLTLYTHYITVSTAPEKSPVCYLHQHDVGGGHQRNPPRWFARIKWNTRTNNTKKDLFFKYYNRPSHSSSHQSLEFHRGCPGSVPRLKWDLWWTMWR